MWLQRILDANITPNKITFNSMIDAYAKAGDPPAAEMWLQQMIVKGFHPDQVTYATLLRAHSCAGEENIEEASRWAYGSHVKAYARAGIISGVRRWLDDMSRAGYSPRHDLRDEMIQIVQSKGDRQFQDQVMQLLNQTVFVDSSISQGSFNKTKQTGVDANHQGRNGFNGPPNNAAMNRYSPPSRKGKKANPKKKGSPAHAASQGHPPGHVAANQRNSNGYQPQAPVAGTQEGFGGQYNRILGSVNQSIQYGEASDLYV
jgi:pentatricopeptide repeat protein